MTTRAFVGLWALAALIVGIGYARVLCAPLAADDYPLWLGVTDGSSGWAAVGIRPGAPFFRPLLAATFTLDARILGADLAERVCWFRLQNLLLHATCAWLLGLVAWRWTRSRVATLWSTALFASCPLHPEAVSWLSARGYPLAGCFVLGTSFCALHEAPARPWWRLLAIAVLGALALLAVEPALPLAAYPFLLLWAVRRTRWGIQVSLVLALVTAAYLVTRVLVLGDLGGYRTAEGASRHTVWNPETTLTGALLALAHLSAPGPWDGADGRMVTVAVCGSMALGAITLLVASLLGGTTRRMLALVLCSLAALSVTVGWASFGSDLSGSRYLYFADMFWCLLLAVAVHAAFTAGGWRRIVAVVACVALPAGQVVLLRVVNERWRQGGELAQAAVEGVVQRVTARGVRHVFLFAPPADYKGAHAMPWGMEAALAVRVGTSLRVDVLADAERFAVVQRVHADATPSERQAIDVGAWDPATRAWRWE
jgi:hypothetical protein